mmetsp:Transcript_4007/g.6516  ORF Transcript_4007/g.6516 Transcript_4007/m.6516 type:complete len:367 (-) Transcript_4007:89-1189(-)
MTDRGFGITCKHREARTRHTIHELIAFNREDLVVELWLTVLHLHAQVHQTLLRYRVGHIELQHHVLIKDMLDACHHILRLTLGQLHRRARPEHTAELAELWNGVHSGCRVHHFRLCGKSAAATPTPATTATTAACRAGRSVSKAVLLDGFHWLFHNWQRINTERLAIFYTPMRRVEFDGLLEVGERHGQRLKHHRSLLRHDVHPVLLLLLLSGQRRLLQPLLLVHNGEVETIECSQGHRGAVAHLVVLVKERAREQDADGTADTGHLRSEARQGRNRGGAHLRVLKDDAIVDETDITRRRLGGRTERADEVEDLGRESREFTVLDELAQVQERRLLSLRDGMHELDNGVGDSLLEFEPALLAQGRR